MGEMQVQKNKLWWGKTFCIEHRKEKTLESDVENML